MLYDLLIKGGTLIDPAQSIHAKRDVAFVNGAVACVGDDLPKGEAREVLDVTDRIVTPGLIDLHVTCSTALVITASNLILPASRKAPQQSSTPVRRVRTISPVFGSM